jgi:hypothetical protein
MPRHCDTGRDGGSPEGGLAPLAAGLRRFLLLPAAWAVAAPYNGPPDEQEHGVRAAGVPRVRSRLCRRRRARTARPARMPGLCDGPAVQR